MSLFYNPQKSGKGVSKEEATSTNKKPTKKFAEIFGGKFWQIMQLNFVYVLMCLPIITIGPATAALTHVMRQFIAEKPMVSVFGEFFAAFRKHFKRTVIVGIFSAIFVASLIVNLMIFFASANADAPQSTLLIAMNMAAAIVFFVMNTYIYPQIVCLDLPMNAIIKNSLVLTMAGFKRNIVTVLVFSATLFLLLFAMPFPTQLLLLPVAPFAQLAFVCVFNSYAVILKYIVDPYYETKGEKNPELKDFTTKSEKGDNGGEKPNIFTDLGGKELPINKKNVKTSGKVIK